jgi:ribosomal protein L37AE/L43A
MFLKDFKNSTLNLPTAKEYRKTVDMISRWSEPKYQCYKCGGGMCKDLTTVLLTHPAQYIYRCDKCGRIEYCQ